MRKGKGRSLVLDSNLLVLLVVGLVDRQLILKHKRTRSFEPEDFDLLTQILSEYEEIVVTPNVMTEASNLASQVAEPNLSAVRQRIAILAGSLREEYCPSAEATTLAPYLRLGLTDCALLALAGTQAPLLTTDLDLYLEAAKFNRLAKNFNHLREARLLNA